MQYYCFGYISKKQVCRSNKCNAVCTHVNGNLLGFDNDIN